MSQVTITDDEFHALAELVQQRFGIHLTEKKRHLVVGRLQKLLRKSGQNNFSEYLHAVQTDSSGDALMDMINDISTNHTYFYRESGHFEFFYDHVLPELKRQCQQEGSRDIRIWCAGCSSGEEPYMLAMLMMEFFAAEYPQWRAGVLATDIARDAMSKARHARYDPESVERVPEKLRKKYFRAVNENQIEVVDAVRKEVVFRSFNLMQTTLPFRKQFHVIFCRNVMIYFDKQTKDSLVQRFHQAIVPGGYLFIGHSESAQGTPGFEYALPAGYRKLH